MELIDKFKSTEKKKEIPKEAQIKGVKDNAISQAKENSKQTGEQAEKSEDDKLEKAIFAFKDSYAKSDKTSRMIRLQEDNFEMLAKLKAHNIGISEFLNFSIYITSKSEQYQKMIKIFKTKK